MFRLFIPILALICAISAKANLTFTGNSAAAVAVTPESSTGLEAVYVLETTDGAKASYAYSGAAPEWIRFSNLGGAYGEQVSAANSAGVSTITLSKGDMGYIVTHNGRQHCFWVVDYSLHRLQLGSLTPDAESSDCDRLALRFEGSAAPINYYTINGRQCELSRDLQLSYTTLSFDETSFSYTATTATDAVSHIGSTLAVPAPLCDTEFSITGDRFLNEWHKPQSVVSPMVRASAVAVRTRATQTGSDSDDNSNQIKDEGAGGLGGSAPAEITFSAAVSDGVVFREWQMAKDPDFEYIDYRFNDLDVTYTFTDQGTTYVRFMAANESGSCDAFGDTYEIYIGESDLKCPNAFSPGASPGVNDEWKVSYKSLISFECSIFNRWGTKMISFNNPSMGWDGKYRGKLVPAGVYYYVIKARGADGREYNLKGDINIVGSSTRPGSSSGSTDAE